MTNHDPEEQYKSPVNLLSRSGFNQRYGTRSWFGWIAEQVAAPTGHVLDIGCGTGAFWTSVAGRWTPARLTLADTSDGMLEHAGVRLAYHYTTDTVLADAMALPFDGASFDDVVAMHMLYHTRDPAQALSEIFRVLKPGGRAIITTVGDDDLEVLSDLSREVFGRSGSDLVVPVFGARRAGPLIAAQFDSVAHSVFQDRFRIDDTEVAADFITSFPPGESATPEQVDRFKTRFEAMGRAGGGVVETDRFQHLFVATRP